MKTTTYPAILLLFIVLNACTDEIVSPGNEVDMPVVEAFLKPGIEVSVALKKMVTYDDNGYTEPEAIEVDTVHIVFNGTNYALTPVIDQPGKYTSSDTTLVAESGGTYDLSFFYNGDTVTSSTTIPTRPMNPGLSTSVLHIDPYVRGPGSVLEPMTVTWTNPDNTYHLIVLEYLNGTYTPISENLDPDRYADFRKVSTEPILGTSFDLDTRQHLVFFWHL